MLANRVYWLMQFDFCACVRACMHVFWLYCARARFFCCDLIERCVDTFQSNVPSDQQQNSVDCIGQSWSLSLTMIYIPNTSQMIHQKKRRKTNSTCIAFVYSFLLTVKAVNGASHCLRMLATNQDQQTPKNLVWNKWNLWCD